VHCDTSDQITRAKDLLKHTGAQDISSSGEASADLSRDQQGRGAPVELCRGGWRRLRLPPVVRVRIKTLTGPSGEQSKSRTIRRRAAYQYLKGEHKMKPSTKDELEGKLHETKGKVKEKVGQVINNPEMETKGQDEKLAGKVQKKVGQVEKVLEK
jgi:uncharacterized protein YjbJ (UPF0337 family)